MSAKCNHLVPKYEQNKKCTTDLDSKIHYWIPTGHIEAKFNNTVQVDFMCKYCNKRVTSFLSQVEYETYKNLLGA
jgi:hypothetical protein